MSRAITIDARWDANAGVWLATSTDVPGLVVEAPTWPTMMDEVRIVLPDLLDLDGESTKAIECDELDWLTVQL